MSEQSSLLHEAYCEGFLSDQPDAGDREWGLSMCKACMFDVLYQLHMAQDHDQDSV